MLYKTFFCAFVVPLQHQTTGKMVKRWTVGLSHFPGCAEGPSCETGGIPERTTIMYKNTDLCMDVKTFLQGDKRTKLGKEYQGVLTRITSELYTFVEKAPSRQKRHPRVFNGKYITITRQADGSLRPNFKPMPTGRNFSIHEYALGVANELRIALEGLVEEESWRPFGW